MCVLVSQLQQVTRVLVAKATSLLPVANKVENIDHGQVWACLSICEVNFCFIVTDGQIRNFLFVVNSCYEAAEITMLLALVYVDPLQSLQVINARRVDHSTSALGRKFVYAWPYMEC